MTGQSTCAECGQRHSNRNWTFTHGDPIDSEAIHASDNHEIVIRDNGSYCVVNGRLNVGLCNQCIGNTTKDVFNVFFKLSSILLGIGIVGLTLYFLVPRSPVLTLVFVLAGVGGILGFILQFTSEELNPFVASKNQIAELARSKGFKLTDSSLVIDDGTYHRWKERADMLLNPTALVKGLLKRGLNAKTFVELAQREGFVIKDEDEFGLHMYRGDTKLIVTVLDSYDPKRIYTLAMKVGDEPSFSLVDEGALLSPYR